MTVATIEPYMIGASSVPAILGLDKFCTPYALGVRLLEGRQDEPSEAAQMGLDLEEPHAELVKNAGYDVLAAPAAGFTHPDLPWLCVHPDGLIALDGVRSPLELKCRGLAPSDEIRMRDTVQSLVQVHAMGASQGLVSVLHGGFGGIRRDEWTVAADWDLFGSVVARCESFLSQLRRGVLPAPDGSDATRDAIRRRFAHADAGATVRATAECWGWVKRKRELAEVRKTAKEQEAVYEHKIQAFMGDATELISPLDTLAATWRPQERTSVDVTRLKRDRPEIAGEYAKTTTSRRFEANP